MRQHIDVLNERGWQLAADENPPVAAHVVTARRGYTHHGIYVGNGHVVHYAGLSRSWRPGPVEQVSLAEFAGGRPVRVRPCRNPQFDSHQIVARARSRIGENRYRILTNNCEHFCEWCLRGRSRSSQVDRLRNRLRDVLTAAVPFIGRLRSALREATSGWHGWSNCVRA